MLSPAGETVTGFRARFAGAFFVATFIAAFVAAVFPAAVFFAGAGLATTLTFFAAADFPVTFFEQAVLLPGLASPAPLRDQGHRVQASLGQFLPSGMERSEIFAGRLVREKQRWRSSHQSLTKQRSRECYCGGRPSLPA